MGIKEHLKMYDLLSCEEFNRIGNLMQCVLANLTAFHDFLVSFIVLFGFLEEMDPDSSDTAAIYVAYTYCDLPLSSSNSHIILIVSKAT